MLIFLTGLSQILAGVATGSDALDPGDVGLRVKDDPANDKKSKEKSLKSKEEKSDSSARPGTQEQPIVVGEAQNKFKLKKLLSEYQKYK